MDELRPETMHLLALDDDLPDWHAHRRYPSLCGALVAANSLPSSMCPEGCECDLALYCPDCARLAAEGSAR